MACVNMACFMRDWKETGQQISGLHCCQNSFALLDLPKIFNTFAEMKLHKMRSEDPAAYSSPLQLTLSPCSSPSSVITLFTCCCPQSLSDPFPRPVQITNLGEKWCRNKMRFFLLGKWSEQRVWEYTTCIRNDPKGGGWIYGWERWKRGVSFW